MLFLDRTNKAAVRYFIVQNKTASPIAVCLVAWTDCVVADWVKADAWFLAFLEKTNVAASEMEIERQTLNAD